MSTPRRTRYQNKMQCRSEYSECARAVPASSHDIQHGMTGYKSRTKFTREKKKSPVAVLLHYSYTRQPFSHRRKDGIRLISPSVSARRPNTFIFALFRRLAEHCVTSATDPHWLLARLIGCHIQSATIASQSRSAETFYWSVAMG